ncbi:MAG TPA: CHAT domain-containing tetratricopeptide repeat protein, partial [Thermoanaerobaculia bacterium]|nr:CHAT domain-containing tetratricopeptide repeat protein [Thermoanaerobaculia bacterium]
RGVRILCAAALLLAACGSPVREWPAGELRSGGRPVTASLGPEEVHQYRLPLEKGFLLRLVVEQQGVDAVVALDDPAGARVLEADRLINDRGPELVLAVADRSGDYSLVVRGPEGSGPGRYEARIEALRPASEADRRSAAAYRLFTGAEELEADEAMARRKQALATWRELGEKALVAEALERIAKQHMDRREPQPAAALYREAAATFARVGDRRREAMVRANLGAALLDLGEAQEAVDQYVRALPGARQEGDRLTEAKALHGLGQAFQRQGEPQRALDQYRKALALWPQGNVMRPRTLHQLGVLYARHLHDERRGRELLLAALEAWGPGDERDKGHTSSQLGRLSYEQGRLDEARRYFEEALALRKESAPCTRAVILARLALVEERQGKRPAADARRTEALSLLGTSTCRRSEPATVHLLAGELAERRDDAAEARAHYQKSEGISAGLGDQLGVAESLKGIARNARSLGDLQTAREANQRALYIYQGVRPTVLSDDLRTSFFAGAQPAFDFQIDLLLEMGAGEEAWAIAEEARARVLRDLLAEAGADLRRGASPTQEVQERSLWQQLNVLETLRSKAEPEQLPPLRQQIDARIADLEALRGEIRRRSPRYASLIQPEPVSLAAVQRELLDDDTVLLEYRLGEEASTVWAVTRDALTAVRLPPRSEIETAAREAAGWMQSLEGKDRRNPPVLCELSRMLLAPVAPFLGHRRLVVVADGALEALSFAALPMPAANCPEAPALVDAHEIVSLPSAATLLAQRRLLAGRQPVPGWLAVVADPVYRSDRRLPGTAQEGKEIVAGLPAGKVFVATGPDASRKTVTGGKLRGFRILHFAAHGLLDAEQPLLSALALSEVDPAGQPVQSELRAHEIYDLDLPAELVVLSACETALGRDVPGEGLVSGLPRAFLYAGAARVLVSLWEVEDRSTHDLMVRFYRGLLERKLPPAQALQDAQRALRQAGRPPRQWAGFVLLGDWRPLPPFSD